ncbi:hypothetical protein JCM10908_000535 [Rhodotorula pacifica]|uniref:uncharacterized protein n=1 Tax=Rhodotorula pacifica TaxID=1495444 RepID=UPI00317AAB38
MADRSGVDGHHDFAATSQPVPLLSSSPTRYDPVDSSQPQLSTSNSSRHSVEHLQQQQQRYSYAQPRHHNSREGRHAPPLTTTTANHSHQQRGGTESSSSSSENRSTPISSSGSRSSSPSRRNAGPRRGSSGEAPLPAVPQRIPPMRYNSADAFAPPIPPVASTSSSSSSSPAGYTADEAGLAGRGAGPGGGRTMQPMVPTINTHMMSGSGANLLSPVAGPSSASASVGIYGSSSASANDSRSSLLGGRRPPPLQISTDEPVSFGLPGPRTPTHALSPSMSQQANHRGSPSHSHSLPSSQSNSTLSSHSHSHSHSVSGHYTTVAGRSPITATFSRPPQQQQPYPPSSPYARSPAGGNPPASSDGGHSTMSGSRSRGNSAASGELRDGADRDRERGRDQREARRGGGGGGERDRSRKREKDRKDEAAGARTNGAASGLTATAPATCAKCDLPMTGQFVRALGTVYHLDCFRCMDCNKVVAAKFFPIDAPDGSGRQVPLCETDYFRRLNLLCNKCGQALRGSYITALDMKFHVEHFTCSVCPTVFGPQDSYYEHAGSVYCHFHYSTRFAVKCTGCRTAILKQFVEINRNSIDEHWHPECYMIHKFWNIKLAPTPKSVQEAPIEGAAAPDGSNEGHTPAPASTATTSPPEYLAIEEKETPSSLKSRQKRMEEQVYRIWTILSAFEESSAACISEMLRHVSSGHYMEGVGMAEKFVLHVETLFAAIDDLNEAFRNAGAKEMQHVREARMLCKKIVNFFMLLSHTHETGARKMSITQDLLSLVTGLAHYLKILIRIALTGSLKLEREYDDRHAINVFLGRLDRLARDPEANKISTTVLALARNGAAHSDPPSRQNSGQSAQSASDEGSANGHARPAYGYKSLARAVGTLIGQGEATTDLCEGCRFTVEEECARLGTSIRWHMACLRCATCQKLASRDPSDDEVALVDFVWADDGSDTGRRTTFCRSCAPSDGKGASRDGFEYVTRLEQYAFLLCVALNKLFGRLKQRGIVPVSQPAEDGDSRGLTDIYRDSNDIKRMKSFQLDRKLSSTNAHVPKRSTVVQSPSGRTATSDATDSTFQLFQTKPPVPSRKDQPLIDPVSGMPIPRNQVREVAPPSSQATPTPSAGVTPTATPSLASGALNPLAAAHPQHQQLPSPTSSPKRPPMDRRTTAVRIVDDPGLPGSHGEPDGLGGQREPTQDEDGLTLADLPKALEAEQKRAAAPDGHLQPTPRGGYNGGPTSYPLTPNMSGASVGSRLLSELSALESFIVKHVAAVLLSSDTSPLREYVTLDELLDIIDARKNTFWGKLFKPGGGDKKKVPKKGVFGIPLEVLVERNGADSMHGAGPGSLRVPSFVDDLISAMKQMDMSVEGIFRKNGNIRRLKELTEALDRDAGSVNLSDDNPVQLAALLKKFLRDLPDPLMCFKLFHLWIAAQRIENAVERNRTRHYICCLMPKAHRDTMEVLFVFLKWVASFSHVDEETGSKMDLQNLATVISPNILYAKGKDPVRDESFSAARVVHELLERQDEYWEVPVECLSILNDQELLSNPAQLTSKEILLRAESHIRLNGAAGHLRVSRGQTGAQRRPGLQEAWSAPHLTGSGRPLSTSVTPSRFRSPERDPRGAPNPQGLPPHLAAMAPSRTASPHQLGAANAGNGADETSRRGASEGNTPRSDRSPAMSHPYQQQPPPFQQR